MNEIERRDLKALIIATSAYYGQQVRDDAIKLYVEDLADLEFSDVSRMIGELRRDPRTRGFPLPAVIRDRLRPAVSEDNLGREVAGRIISAVVRFGWCNPSQAREFIGDLGWRVLSDLQGGWRSFCETLNHDNVTTMQAQLREQVVTTIRLSRSGELNQPPALPAPASASQPRIGLSRLNLMIAQNGDR